MIRRGQNEKSAHKIIAASLIALSGFWAPAARAAQIISIADVVEKVMAGVVNVRTRDVAENSSDDDIVKRGDIRQMDRFFQLFLMPGDLGMAKQARSLGSGFIYRAKEYVVTNYHVIKDAESIDIVTSNARFGRRAKVVGFNRKIDVAVLKMDPPDSAIVLKFGSSEKARIGEGVFAIGNPFGFGHTVTSGILSARGRTIGTGPFDDYLQTDAAVNPGNSGGPLFNFKGEVIGINTAVLSDAHGISFAISSEIAKNTVDGIILGKGSQRVWLGVVANNLVEDNDSSKESYGVFVQNLAKGSPAELGGMRAGDVILGINNTQVRDASGLERVVRKLKPGESVTLKVHRGGEPVKVILKTALMPDTDAVDKMESLF